MALNPLDRLVRDMEDVKRQLAGRSQLNHSSLENTAIPVYDANDVERLRIGAQDDGTHAVVYVQGPPPPRPTAPVVSVDGPVVRVRWDGQLMGGHIPEDFSRIDVHFALASDDIEDASAVRANLATAAGSEATLMATQTGTYRVGLVAMSQSRARSEMSETVEVVVQVVDLATAIETATQSANGKNTVVYSERSPEPTDEGSVGDTWFVNEIRPRDPEDPASGVVIAIIEQWQHTGTVWVQVEMAHEVIASVDLGRASVGYLSGQRIESESIGTEQLEFGAATGDIVSADAMNFREAWGLTVRAGAFYAGDRVEVTEDFGIRQFGPDGELNVNFPSDGSPASLRGDLSARTLTATGRMSIQGPGSVASGGVLELESGVVPPLSPPQVSLWWEMTSMPPVADGESVSGLVWADGHWWRGVQVSGASSSNSIRARVEKVTAEGELVASFPTEFGARINGITYLGGLLYVLGAVVGGVKNNRFVVAYNLQGVEQRRWEYLSYGTGTYQPGIGTSGTNIYIAQCWASGELSWRIYRPTDGYQIQRVDLDSRVASDIVSINVGSYDLGVSRIVVGASRQTSSSMQVLVYTNSSTPTFVGQESWYAADYAAIRGLGWDGDRFYSMQPSGGLAAYEPNEAGRFLGDNDRDWRVAIGWASEDGSSRTPAGPVSEPFRFLRRSRHSKTVTDMPDGVEVARFYYAKTEEPPDRTELHYVSFIRAGSARAWSGSLPESWASRSNPPEGNSYVTDAPGVLRSALGSFRVDGVGAGRWGPLEFHMDGSMSDSSRRIASGQISVDATANVTMITTVTFPVGLFTREPILLITPRTDALSQTPLVGSRNVTAESAQIAFRRSNAVTTLVNWLAIEQEG